jgi:uncharacterized Fe-S cluster protein YjdI
MVNLMKELTKEYTNGEITVIWKPNICTHSTKCFNGLPQVFDPKSRPWITPEGASSEEIIRQVGICPSGALTFTLNKENTEL